MNPNDKRNLTLIMTLLAVVGIASILCVWSLRNKSSAEPSATTAVSTETSETAEGQEVRIKLFETSDIHGYLVDTTSCDKQTFQYRLARIADFVSDARENPEYDDVILLDGGDCYQGATISNMTNGAAVRAAMDIMDYDAVCLGNHEFDWGVTDYAAELDGTVPPYDVAGYIGDPNTPVLASNLYYKETGERVSFTKDYVILDKAGCRIAVIGWIPDYSSSVIASRIEDYYIDMSTEHFAARVHEIIEEESPDATIILCHEAPVILSQDFTYEDVQVICGGHTHEDCVSVSDTAITLLQPNCQAKGFASATIVIDAEGNVDIEDAEYTSIVDDPEETYFYDESDLERFDIHILDISDAVWDSLSEKMTEVLGYITEPVVEADRTGDNTGTVIGNFYTKVMLRATQEYGTQVAFFNNNGIRTEYPLNEGETERNITVGDIYSIAPFGNTWLIYDLTAPELKQHLINGLTQSRYGDQMTGLTFTFYNRGSADAPDFDIVSITLDDGTEIDMDDPNTTIRVCVSAYSASIEDSIFAGKVPVVSESEGLIDNELMISTLREMGRENPNLEVDRSPRGRLVTQQEYEAYIADAA